MFGFHRDSNMFATKVIYKNPEPKLLVPEVKDIEIIPKTRAEAREQNKKKYLPAERLAIQLHKQLKKEKKEKKEIIAEDAPLDEQDIEKITDSMRRIMGSLLS